MAEVTEAVPRVLVPGLANLSPGVERYRIRGGAVTALLLSAGDTLEINDPEGCQPVEVTAFDREGQSEPGLLGAQTSGPAAGIVGILHGGGEDARRVADALAEQSVDISSARAIHGFGPDSLAGETLSLTAQADLVCVIGVPGAKMRAHEQNPPTDVVAWVTRSSAPPGGLEVLPDPLADQTQDFRIAKATARAYQVTAGEFIQVIDVEGRECSDFQCFSVADLDRGVERSLDATMTRSLMGAAYPLPGLYSKYFDVNMGPMLEVVQDTVGRHDTFNTACNPKYYDDPMEFRPERWTREFERTLPRGAYTPFAGGPRVCLGKQFAMMEMRMILATLLQRVEPNLAEGFEPGKILDVQAGDKSFQVKARVDTPLEIEYLKNGGVLNYVLRNFIAEA